MTTEKQTPGVPTEFVYCGRRLLQGGGIGVALWPVIGKELQGDYLIFAYDRKNRIVGGVYAGAELVGKDKIRGMAGMRYRRDFGGPLVGAWESEDHHVKVETEYAAIERKHQPRIERMMAGVRTERAEIARRDWQKVAAFDRYVNDLLKRPL